MIFSYLIWGKSPKNTMINSIHLRHKRNLPTLSRTVSSDFSNAHCHILVIKSGTILNGNMFSWDPTKSFNSLTPGRSECDSKNVIFNLVLLIGIFRSSHDNALWWMSQDLTDDQSTMVQVMAWCRQATIHYLSQCWPRSLSPYGVTRPQWVNTLRPMMACFTHG